LPDGAGLMAGATSGGTFARWAAWLVCASIALACAPAAACPRAEAAKGAPTPPEAAKAAAEPKFDWPALGRLVMECWTKGKTIVIAVDDGAEVRAAQSGRVVFAGQFKGYGDLVLISHDGGFVSATYGDIGGLRVKAGDHVDLGQPIAGMWSLEDKAAVLRFELRLGSEPIDPTR